MREREGELSAETCREAVCEVVLDSNTTGGKDGSYEPAEDIRDKREEAREDERCSAEAVREISPERVPSSVRSGIGEKAGAQGSYFGIKCLLPGVR